MIFLILGVKIWLSRAINVVTNLKKADSIQTENIKMGLNS